jgi:tetratricopeptide (TPR) repeat protein
VLILLGTVAAYWPALHNGFIWDDGFYIIQNEKFIQPDALQLIWLGKARLPYYPLTWSMFLLEWRCFGASPLPYHIVNVALHALGSFLIYLVLRRLGLRLAPLVGLLFAVHPVNVTTVTWISEGKNTLSLVFYALTVWFYLDTERPACYALSLLSFVAAVLAKTTGVGLPAALLLINWWRQGSLTRRDWLRVASFACISAAVVVSAILVENKAVMGNIIVRPEGLLSRLAVAGMALWFYAGKTLLPTHLMMIYPRWSPDIASPLSYLPLLAFLALAGLLWVKRGSWGRGPLAALGWYVLMLLPVLGISDTSFDMLSLVADHWQYLAIVATLAALMQLLSRLPGPTGLPLALGAMAVVVCSVLTWQRCPDFADEHTMYAANVRENPNYLLGQFNLAVYDDERGNSERAEAEYREALRVDPHYRPAAINLAILLRKAGRLDESIRMCESALADQDDNDLRVGSPVPGDFERALRAQPQHIDAHYNLAIAELMAGHAEAAVTHFEAVAELLKQGVKLHCDPDQQNTEQSHVFANLAVTLSSLHRGDEAVAAARQACELAPGTPQLEFNLGYVLEQAGQYEPALTQYRKVLQLQSDYAPAISRQAWIMATASQAQVRNAADALKLATQACEMTSNGDPFALDALAASNAAAGNYREAIDKARLARDLYPAGPLRAEVEKRIGLYNLMQPYIANESSAAAR